MDRQMELLERDHRVHIRVHEQKVQNLEYEHKNLRRQVALDSDMSIQHEREEHNSRIIDMNRDKLREKETLREKQHSNAEDVKMMRLGNEKMLHKLRENFEQNHTLLEEQYEAQVVQLKTDLELRRKVEIHEIEERKNQHINELLFNHQEAFDEIKAYYNEITHDNLQLIKSLRGEISQMKEKEKQNQKKMADLSKENKELSEPLEQKLIEQRDLEEKLKSYEKDKMALKNLRAYNKTLEDRILEARTEYKSTDDRYRKIDKERDEFNRKFTKVVRDVERRAQVGKNAVLEKRLEVLQAQFDDKQAHLSEVLRTARIDPAVVANVTRRLETELGTKNQQIKNLQYQVYQVTKAYNDTIRVYEHKLPALGIDPEEIGFEPIMSDTSLMPARLVTKTK